MDQCSPAENAHVSRNDIHSMGRCMRPIAKFDVSQLQAQSGSSKSHSDKRRASRGTTHPHCHSCHTVPTGLASLIRPGV